MKDMKIKGTGNSRFLKSNIPAGTTIEQLVAMLNAGTFPFDFNGVNAEGIEEMGSALNKGNLLPDDVAELLGITIEDPQVKDAFQALKEYAELGKWELLAEYNVAGSYNFIVPDDVDELGVLILGGGGSGGVAIGSNGDFTNCATGGGSGNIDQFILKKADGDFEEGGTLAAVVGVGGVAAASPRGGGLVGNPGGSSSFAGKTVIGGPGGKASVNAGTTYSYEVAGSEGEGQSSDAGNTHHTNISRTTGKPAPFGLVSYMTNVGNNISAVIRRNMSEARNAFDRGDLHTYCGAGGAAFVWHSNSNYYVQTAPERAKGSAGRGRAGNGTNSVTGYSATAPGDGGGALAWNANSGTATYYSGAGADGLVLVYGRKTA